MIREQVVNLWPQGMARHRRQKSPTFNQSMKLQINE